MIVVVVVVVFCWGCLCCCGLFDCGKMNSWIGHAFPKWKVGKVGKFGEAEIGNRKSEAKIAEVFLQIFSKLNNNTHQYTCIEIEIGIRTNWEKLCRRNNVFFCGKFARKILILANFWKRKVFFYFELWEKWWKAVSASIWFWEDCEKS